MPAETLSDIMKRNQPPRPVVSLEPLQQDAGGVMPTDLYPTHVEKGTNQLKLSEIMERKPSQVAENTSSPEIEKQKEEFRAILLDLDTVLKNGDKYAILSRGFDLLAQVRDFPLPNDVKGDMVTKLSPHTVMFAKAARQMSLSRSGAASSSRKQEYGYIETARNEAAALQGSYAILAMMKKEQLEENQEIESFLKNPQTKKGKSKLREFFAKRRAKRKERVKKFLSGIKRIFGLGNKAEQEVALQDLETNEKYHRDMSEISRQKAANAEALAAQYPVGSKEHNQYKEIANQYRQEAASHHECCTSCCEVKNDCLYNHEHHHNHTHEYETENHHQHSENHVQENKTTVSSVVVSIETPKPPQLASVQKDTEDNLEVQSQKKENIGSLSKTIATLGGAQSVKEVDEAEEQAIRDATRSQAQITA